MVWLQSCRGDLSSIEHSPNSLHKALPITIHQLIPRMSLYALLDGTLTFLSLLTEMLLNYRAPLARFIIWLGMFIPGVLRVESNILTYFQAVATIKSALDSVVWVVGGGRMKMMLDNMEKKGFETSPWLGRSVRPLGVIAVFVVAYLTAKTTFVEAMQTISNLKEIMDIGEAGAPTNERVRVEVEEMKGKLKARYGVPSTVLHIHINQQNTIRRALEMLAVSATEDYLSAGYSPSLFILQVVRWACGGFERIGGKQAHF